MLGLILICLLVIIGIVAGIIWKYKYELIVVRGISMNPTLNDGDLVLIDKRPKKYCLGDICVANPPVGDHIVIKRITKIDIEGNSSELYFFLVGDNRDKSFDSRDYGFVEEKNIEGRVIRVWQKK